MSKRKQEITPTKAAIGAAAAYLAWRWWKYGAGGIFPSFEAGRDDQSALSEALQRLSSQSQQSVNVYLGRDGSAYASAPTPVEYPARAFLAPGGGGEPIAKVAGPTEYAPAPAAYTTPAAYAPAPAPVPAYSAPAPMEYEAPAPAYVAPTYVKPDAYVAPAPAYVEPAPAPAPTYEKVYEPYVAPVIAPTTSEKMAYDKFDAGTSGTTSTYTSTLKLAGLAGFEALR